MKSAFVQNLAPVRRKLLQARRVASSDESAEAGELLSYEVQLLSEVARLPKQRLAALIAELETLESPSWSQVMHLLCSALNEAALPNER